MLEFLLSVDRVQPHRVVHVVHVQDLDPIKYKINETVKKLIKNEAHRCGFRGSVVPVVD